jgi:hypothetical protein
VITPSLPTLSIASAMMLADLGVVVGAQVPTWAIDLLALTGLACSSIELADDRLDGLRRCRA